MSTGRTDAELDRWRRALRGAAGEHFALIEVLPETDSTQDHLRRLGPRPGMLVAALCQTAGRGRHGRRWIDDHSQGVALSATLPEPLPAPGRTEGIARLMMMVGLAALAAVDESLDQVPASVRTCRPSSGLKWPNDVLVGGRKIAGVLIEVVDGVAVAGIGINVLQPSFEGELAARATSLALEGVQADRCAVAARLVAELARGLVLAEQAPADLLRRYQQRDLLRGTRRTFESGGHRIEGLVRAVDPLRAIEVIGDDGTLMSLDPSLATLVANG